MENCNVQIETSYQDDMNFKSTVDKDVQSVLYPLNLMQIFVFNPKYCMKNNFIKPNNRFYKFLLIFGLMMVLSCYINRVIGIAIDDNIWRYIKIKFLSFASLFDFAYYGAGFIMNVILNFLHSKKIIAFVLTFQEVHRFLSSEASFKWSVRRNWINVSLIFGFYFVTLIFMAVLYNQPPWYVVLNLMFLIGLDTNIVYTISSIKLLADKVGLWNVRVLQTLREEGENLDCDIMFEAYVQILKCYDICKDLFQQPVS